MSSIQPTRNLSNDASTGSDIDPNSRATRDNAAVSANNASKGKDTDLGTSSSTGSYSELLQLDALSAAGTSPLEPKSMQALISSIPSSPQRVSNPLPSSTPTRTTAPGTNSTPGVLTDKARERLLYPGRVNLTSE